VCDAEDNTSGRWDEDFPGFHTGPPSGDAEPDLSRGAGASSVPDYAPLVGSRASIPPILSRKAKAAAVP
jgi:hypothetical protein